MNKEKFFDEKYKHCKNELVKNIYKRAKQSNKNNVVKRHLTSSIIELDRIKDSRNHTLKLNEEMVCYGCNKRTNRTHKNYVYSCLKCGKIFEKYRFLSRDLTDQIALVTGCRAKLGHCITIKLLRAGAVVIGTTRHVKSAIRLYSTYDDFDKWKNRIFFIELNLLNIDEKIDNLFNIINEKFGKLNILINNAAQTIRVREQEREKGEMIEECNRYGDSICVNENDINSWTHTISTVDYDELNEVFKVNCMAPFILVQSLLPLMKKSENKPFIINVHAREGRFNCKKSGIHPHTNMTKAALAMLTKCLYSSSLQTNNGQKFSINGCDPGWFSIDEYKLKESPWITPPIDEIDAAARILYPLFMDLSGNEQTRIHFTKLTI